MRDNSKPDIKRRPRKVRGNPPPPRDSESQAAALFTGLHAAPLVQVVLDSLAYPLYVIDVADYRVRLVNRAAREAYANGAATCYALTHHRDTPCHSEEHPCPIEIIKKTGAPTVVEHVHYDRDGTPKNVEVHAFPIFDDAGALVQIIEYTVDITARKQAEEALHQSEHRFRSTFENAPIGIAHVALDGRILRFNRRFCEIVGCTCNRGPDAACAASPLADDREAERVQIQQLLDGTATQYSIEKRYRRGDGGPVWVNLTRSIQHDETGQVEYFIVLVEDISERKRAEEALRESEERQRRLVENLKGSHFIYVHNTDGVFQYLSESLTDVLGYTPEEFMTHYGRYLTDHPVNEAVRRHTELSIQGIRQPPYEVNIWHKDGSSRWLEVQEVPVCDAAGRVIAVEGVAQDITERKRAEEALRQAEQRFRTIFDTTSDGIFLHDLEARRLIMCNKSFLQMLGYTEEEFTQLGVADLHLQADLPFIDAQIDKVVLGEKAIRHDIRFQRKDGSILFADVSPTLVQLDGARYVLVALKDVTERKRMEEELRQHAEHLEELVAARTTELLHRTRQLQKLTLEMSETEDRERRRLAEILHDDLQQTLAGAKFHVGLMKSQAQHDASLQATVAQIDHLLKDAIEESRRLSHELSPAVLHHADFAETLRWLANQVQAKHGLTAHLHVHGQIRLQSDTLKAFLYRAIQELLFNVIKHARVNEAGIHLRRLGHYVGLSVSDRGRGFDPQALEQTSGFGLLSLRERIELLGGRMKIRSAPGQGSTFWVAVPDGTESRATGGVGPRAYPTSGGHGGPPLRVLLADDHQIVRQGLASLFSEEETIEIIGEATNGREAVNLAHQLHPDVVIMDVSMPLMNGEEATRQIKRHLPEIRIVALSMYEEPETIARMRQAGAESYVLKTAPPEELLAAIRGRPAV